ncbi:hypothetical protein DPMN_002933 [Dreissena polymorpha]|uniref:Uncharacterized protein n=1 Tax=Dreissena polymorpha TaxID=45954 RepID=A0A9D4MKE6_DREPO|nr:hypothetical protein DPMN_002816 [Dreissena polymorpha]KAH3879032.1 hypothetical protein DPMN_002933 [Dreissena polymorpha]
MRLRVNLRENGCKKDVISYDKEVRFCQVLHSFDDIAKMEVLPVPLIPCTTSRAAVDVSSRLDLISCKRRMHSGSGNKWGSACENWA